MFRVFRDLSPSQCQSTLVLTRMQVHHRETTNLFASCSEFDSGKTISIDQFCKKRVKSIAKKHKTLFNRVTPFWRANRELVSKGNVRALRLVTGVGLVLLVVCALCVGVLLADRIRGLSRYS